MSYYELNENQVLKLPYLGPLSRRIYIITKNKNTTITKELYIQKTEAFTTNLIGLLNGLKEKEILEIRYACGVDGFIKIYINEEGNFVGEYTCKLEKTLLDFKKKMGI